MQRLLPLLLLSTLLATAGAQESPPDEAQSQDAGVTASGEKVYTWTDADGVTHYSDTPPPEADAEAVDLSEQPLSTIETGPPGPEAEELLKRRPVQTAPPAEAASPPVQELVDELQQELEAEDDDTIIVESVGSRDRVQELLDELDRETAAEENR